MEYKTKGVCSMAIQYDIDDEQKVHNVKFIGGCSGNTQGVAKLVAKKEKQQKLFYFRS